MASKGAADFHLTVAEEARCWHQWTSSRLFYEKTPGKHASSLRATLGLRFVSDDQFALVFNANGVMVRVVDVSGVADYKPAPFTILG